MAEFKLIEHPKKVVKPWGYEEILIETKDYVLKKLHINAYKQLSKQYHRVKEETIHVIDGVLKVCDEDDDEHTFYAGETVHVPPTAVHRFKAGSFAVSLLEASTPHLDDVVRLEDDYGRC